MLNVMADSRWNVMAHGDAREGNLRRNWRMECVASTHHTTSEHGVSSITTADTRTSAASGRANWRPSVDLNGIVRFAERLNLVSARVKSHFKHSLQRNTEARSRNHCCREKENLIDIQSMWVCSLKYSARNAHAPYYTAICGLSDYTIFFHIIS